MGNTRWKSSLNVTGNISASGNGTITGTLAAASISASAGIDVASGTVDTLTSTVATLTGFSSTNGTITNGTVTALNASYGTVRGFSATNGTVGTLTSTVSTLTGFTGTNGTVTNLTATLGTISAIYKGNGGGTVYGAWSSQGTAYKVHAGTAVLSGGSIAVTTNLATILGMTASALNNFGTVAGTAHISVIFQPAAGTASVVQHALDGSGIAGTTAVSWTAVGT